MQHQPSGGPRYSTCSEVPFHIVSIFLSQVSGLFKPTKDGSRQGGTSVPIQKRHKLLRGFMELYLPRSDDTYQMMRLLAPEADSLVRGNYNLQHASLARALCMAAKVPTHSGTAGKVINWRTRGSSDTVGDFAMACYRNVLLRCIPWNESSANRIKSLTVGQVNAALDELAAKKRLEEKADVLEWLMLRTTKEHMVWIICIILHKLKIGISEETIIKHYHPDAYEMWGLCQNLQTVCTVLRDPNYRPPRKDVEPGLCIYPMLAKMAFSTDSVYAKMQRGSTGGAKKPFRIETKFDGHRYLLHRKLNPATGEDTTLYTSRQGIEHGTRTKLSVFENVFKAQVPAEDIILDGEMVIWNKTRNRFEMFGTLTSAFVAANKEMPATVRLNDKSIMQEGFHGDSEEPSTTYMDKQGGVLAPMLREIELVYIAFDIIYKGSMGSLCRKPLQERSDILRATIKEAPAEGILCGPPGSAVRGRIIPLLPGRELGSRTLSTTATTKEELQAAFDRVTMDDEEEGIVVKRLDSPWTYNQRPDDWMKLKPEYVKIQEIDAVVIGASYGTGTLRGGKLSEFLMGLRLDGEQDASGGPMFVSFSRVGTGLDDEERNRIRDQLEKAGLIQAFDPISGKNLPAAVPSCYKVTGEEKPDFWIRNPEKSVVLELHADIRPIVTKVYAAGVGLRFPRIVRYRDDKGGLQCQSLGEFNQMFEERRADEKERGKRQDGSFLMKANRRKESEARRKKRKSMLPNAYKPADLTGAEKISTALQGCSIGFCVQDKGKKDELVKLASQLGGKPYMIVTETVDFMLAAEDDIYWPRFAQKRDVLRLDWLYEPGGPDPHLPPRPYHYLSMGPVTRTEHFDWTVRFLSDHHDVHGNPWYETLDEEGLDLGNIMKRLIERQAYEKALKDQAQAALRRAREREVLLEAGTARAEQQQKQDANMQGPKTLDEIINDAEQELASIGQALPEGSLFRGKVLYVLDMGPPPPAHLCSLAEMRAGRTHPGCASAAQAKGESGYTASAGATDLLRKLGYTVKKQVHPSKREPAPSPEPEPMATDPDRPEVIIIEGSGESQQQGLHHAPNRGPTAALRAGAHASCAMSLHKAMEGVKQEDNEEDEQVLQGYSPPDLSQSGIPYVGAVSDELLRARRAQEKEQRELHAMHVSFLKLRFEAHGGTVTDQLAKGVTHILVVPQGAMSGQDWAHPCPIPASAAVHALGRAAYSAAATSILTKTAARHRAKAKTAPPPAQPAEGEEPQGMSPAEHAAAAQAAEAALAKLQQQEGSAEQGVGNGDPLEGLEDIQRDAQVGVWF